jgi:hypothetical protein
MDAMAVQRPTVAFLLCVLAGCTASGTLDYIPHQPVVEVKSTTFNGPTPNAAAQRGAACPSRAGSGTCPPERVTCVFDGQGCEVCICSSP